MKEKIDYLVKAWKVVTMNETRDVIHNGAIAVNDGAILDVGKADEIESKYEFKEVLGGSHFVLTPGMVNSHIHITGEP